MSVSVALATCNGGRFLGEQLDSLAAQHRLPDELIVSDDASEDASCAIVEAFASRAPFPVVLRRQSQRVGVAQNFAAAMEMCAGSLIATCDQDDVWHPERLAVAEQVFSDPAVLLTFSDAELVDWDGLKLGHRLWSRSGVRPRDLRAVAGADPFTTLLGRRIVTGATMTVRASLLAAALPIGDGWIHDEWLAAQAALRGRIAVLPGALITYRQHSTNAIGAIADGVGARILRGFTGDRQSRVERQLQQWRVFRAAIAGDSRIASHRLTQLDIRIAHLSQRAGLPKAPLARAGVVLRELATGRYHTGAMGTWSALQDLIG